MNTLYNFRFLIFMLVLGILSSCQKGSQSMLKREDYINMNNFFDFPSESGNWEEMSYGEPGFSLGNHRAVFEIPEDAELVSLTFPWRRSDFEEKKNGFKILNAQTGDTIKNVYAIGANNETIDLIFQPAGGGNIYHFYYFPFNTTGGYYPTVTYLDYDASSNTNWFENYRNTDFTTIPKGSVKSVQSINDFHTFYPMEVVATEMEVLDFLQASQGEYILFPEYREFPIRMKNQLPKHWIDRGIKKGISDEIKRGEYYVFQLGVYPIQGDLKNLSIKYSDLDGGGNSISASQFTCFNIEGTSLEGIEFNKVVDVQENTVQPLWIGVDIPDDIQEGVYSGQLIFRAENSKPDTISLEFKVIEELAISHGDDAPESLSRLRWLNSTLGSEEDQIISPFTPLEVKGKTIQILGREVVLSEDGLPSEINSFFTEEMTSTKESSEPILFSPITFKIISDQTFNLNPADFTIEQISQGKATWIVQSENETLSMKLSGTLEYDGMLNYDLEFVAKDDFAFDNLVFEIPYQREASKYILGLGQKGNRRPEKIDWKWDVTNHHEGVWLGSINKGLQYVLRDKNYERPLNTNFYQSKPLVVPSWDNDGKGGITISSNTNATLASNYTGPGRLNKGDTLDFSIRFLITPFKPLEVGKHFNTRFVHKYVPVDSVAEWGGTVVNVHHANEINPYINYPFYNLEEQKAYIDEAHSKGIKVKLYNTIRELTYKSYELFPMRSLGYEIFNDGEGGGHPWLQEHLQTNYHKAWHAWRVNDASILNKGTSRWTNYYIEGLGWLARNQEIDGLYLDDIAFSRETVKRMVSVLNRERPEIIIDLHSANQFNPRDGFINSAFLYMEHFPYITRLWFGEYFEYNLGPDYWFTEISGLPFGLMGEMLQDCGHPFRGLLYGMTTRLYGNCDPRPIWRLFDEFKIEESRMLGYWISNPPVNTGRNSMKATAYINDKEILIAIASWSNSDERIKLNLDWDQLGINPADAKMEIPEIDGLQQFAEIEYGDNLLIPANQGLIIFLRNSE